MVNLRRRTWLWSVLMLALTISAWTFDLTAWITWTVAGLSVRQLIAAARITYYMGGK